MEPLDHPQGYPDPKSVSPWPTGQRFGVLIAVIGILLGLVFYITGITNFENPDQNKWTQWLSYLVIIAGIFLAIKSHRDNELGGYLNFGRGVGMGMIVSLISGLVSAVWVFIFFKFIATDGIEQIREAAVAQMEDQGMGEEEMEMASGMMETFTSGPMMAVFALVGSLFMGLIISLIASAILQKKTPA